MNLRPPGYEAVSRANRSHFGSDLCFLPLFTRRIFRCFRPALPAFFGFWVKSGSKKILQLQTGSYCFDRAHTIIFSRENTARCADPCTEQSDAKQPRLQSSGLFAPQDAHTPVRRVYLCIVTFLSSIYIHLFQSYSDRLIASL